LPTCANLILKKYENRSALNQLILTQGLQPYRTKQIECNYKALTAIERIAQELEDWKLVKEFTQSNINRNKNSIFVPKDNEATLFVKDALQIGRQRGNDNTYLNYCHDESIYYGENLAILLNLSSEYEKIFNELQNTLKNISKKQEDFTVSLLTKFNLTTPDNLPDWDKINNFFVNIDNFFQKSPSETAAINSMLDLNVDLRKKQTIYTIESYAAWRQFYIQTNKLFMRNYQQRLS